LITVAVALLAVLAGAAALAAESPPAPAFEREIRVAGPGLAAVRLDRHVYEAARSDLGDLRVLDPQGEPVPYALDRGLPGPQPESRPRVRNRGFVGRGSATAVLDFGEKTSKERLALRLSGHNFRRRVSVEGSDDGRDWTMLTDQGWVFAIPGPEAARYETVALPQNDFALLRVTVHPGPRERERVLIEEAWLPAGERRARRVEALEPRWSRADEPRSRETWITLDLGARHQPYRAVEVEVEDERFFREARLDVREDPPLGRSDTIAPPERWIPAGRGVVYRLEDDGESRECLRVEASGRARALRLRLRNRDDRPLRVAGVSVVVPVERLLFEAPREGAYTLTYGAAELGAPTYDLPRTLDEDPEAVAAGLGPPIRREVVADVLPWTERHPVLLWVGLLLVVAVLGALTWRALRSA
jgi:hypothetical protein